MRAGIGQERSVGLERALRSVALGLAPQEQSSRGMGGMGGAGSQMPPAGPAGPQLNISSYSWDVFPSCFSSLCLPTVQEAASCRGKIIGLSQALKPRRLDLNQLINILDPLDLSLFTSKVGTIPTSFAKISCL